MNRGVALPDRVWLRIAAACTAMVFASGALSDPISTGPANAAVENTFSLSVADTELYDSNLFKLPSGVGNVVVVGSPTTAKADEYNVAGVSSDLQRVFGRQTFDLNGAINQEEFKNNSQLDNTSGNGRFLWDWEIGPYLSGQASAFYSRTLAGFAETLYDGKDLVDTTSYFADARYQIGPRWALLAEVQSDDTTHGAEAVYYNNFRDQTVSGGVEFALSPVDTFSLVYHRFDGKYPRVYLYDGAPLNRNYHEDFPQLYVKYAISDKTTFDGNIGHITRTYEDVSIGRYEGIIYRAGVNYQWTDKVSFMVRGWHEIHAYAASDSDFFIAKGYSIGPHYAVTAKLSLTELAETESDSYLLGSTSQLLFGSRKDKQNFEQLNIHYSPRDKWNVNLFLRHFERSSNQALVGFDDQYATFSVSYSFF